ncbi:MAG: type III-A CRISPR-associated protein Cas10/Csm1, partial [Promethearchaeia archaeon]
HLLGDAYKRQYLRRATNFDLKLFCTYITFNPDKFKDFSKPIKDLFTKLSYKKKQLFDFILNDINELDNLFQPSEVTGKLCSSCNRIEIIDCNDKNLCEYCEKQEEIGNSLIDIKKFCYIVDEINFDKIEQQAKEIGELFLSLRELGIVIILPIERNIPYVDFTQFKDSKKYIEIINSLNITELINILQSNDEDQNLSINYRFLGKKVPKWNEDFKDNQETFKKGTIVSFDQIAKYGSEGAKYIGSLKMDIDNLGAIFSSGLQEDRTIDRLSQLSLMVDLFFGYYINFICSIDFISEQLKKSIELDDIITKDDIKEFEIIKEISDIYYIVFSGGDDLFIIGPWDKIIYLSYAIHKKFREFTGYNPYFTISGGIFFINNPKYPIHHLADNAERELERAKDWRKYKDFAWIKNNICIFEDVLNWDEKLNSFKDLLWFSFYLNRQVQDSKFLSKSKLYQILNLYYNYVSGDSINPKYYPSLIYVLREFFDKKKGERDLGEQLLKYFREYFNKINIPIYITLLKGRE